LTAVLVTGALLLGGLGFAAWWFALRDSSPPVAVAPPSDLPTLTPGLNTATEAPPELTPTQAPPAKPTADAAICMINLSLGGDYYASIDNAVRWRANELGWTVDSFNADGDIDKLVSNVQACLASEADGIILSGAWVNDYPEALDEIDRAGIPVVLVDRLTTTENFTAWVGPENTNMGQEVGRYLADQLPGGGTAVIIRGGPEDNSIGLARTAGAQAAFADAGIRVEVATDFGAWNADDGQKAMKNVIAQMNGTIDIVFCENDDMCLGALEAANDAGLNHIIFGGIDGSQYAKAEMSVAGSRYLVTSFSDPELIGSQGVDVLNDIFGGNSVVKMQGIYSQLITQANVQDYL